MPLEHEPERKPLRPLDYWDLAVAVALSLVGAAATVALPGGDPLRLLLVAPVLLFAPGYLLMEASRPRTPTPNGRVFHASMSIGLSLAFVMLIAITTALAPGGFRPSAIITMVTATCIALGIFATMRRRTFELHASERPSAPPRAAPAPPPTPPSPGRPSQDSPWREVPRPATIAPRSNPQAATASVAPQSQETPRASPNVPARPPVAATPSRTVQTGRY